MTALSSRWSPLRFRLKALTLTFLSPLRGISASPISDQRPYSLEKSSISSTLALNLSMSTEMACGPPGSVRGSSRGRRMTRIWSALISVAWKRRISRGQ
ncbi:hypothetical protein D3C81_1548810 [compost metagenome]